MPNRIIKESMCSSEKVAGLTDFEFRLWIGLITQADDAGRGDARPAIIKGRVFPFRERLSIKDIDAALQVLAAKGCVSLYTVDGKPYFLFPGWVKHQRVRDCKPKYPEPPENTRSPQSAASCGVLPQLAALIQSESESESEITSPDGLVCRTGDVRRVVSAWNDLGLGQIVKIDPSTKRGNNLRARITGYGIDKVLEAIEAIKSSDFLKGQNKNGWVITFDWFVKPNNFVKVLEHNFDRRTPSGKPDGAEPVRKYNHDTGKWEIVGG